MSGRASFERWMVEEKKCVVGSSDPYPASIERDAWEAWQASRAALTGEHSARIAQLEAALRCLIVEAIETLLVIGEIPVTEKIVRIAMQKAEGSDSSVGRALAALKGDMPAPPPRPPSPPMREIKGLW